MTNFAKKFFVILTLILLVTGMVTAGVSATAEGAVNGPEPDYYLGDVNADNAVAVNDAIIILRHIVGLDKFNEDLTDNEALQRADVNLDGDVTVTDAILVLRYIVGLTKEFEPNDPATVITETALLIVMGSDVETVNIARDIVLVDSLDIDRDITINGENKEDADNNYSLTGEEVTVTENVESFTAQNIEIEILTLKGGGNESVNLFNAQISILNVEADVTINIDDDSNVEQANFNSDATVTGGKNIENALIGTGVNVDFGTDEPQNTVYELDVNVSLSEPGIKTAGAEFDIKITLTDDNKTGNYNVTVDSDLDSIINEETAFTDGAATVTISLTKAGNHELTVSVDVDDISLEAVLTLEVASAEADNLNIVNQPPAETIAGANISPAPKVKVVDAYGNAVSGVNVKAETVGVFAVGSVSEINTENGHAQFTELALEEAGSYLLVFSVNDLFVISDEFDIISGAIDAGISGAVPFLETVTAGVDNVELDITIADAFGNSIAGLFDVIVGSGDDVWHDSSAGEFLPQWLLPLIQSTTTGAVQFVDGEAVLTLTVTEAGEYVGVPVTVDGVEVDTFNLTVLPAGPAEFALNVDSTLPTSPAEIAPNADTGSLVYTFSSFVDEYGNEIDVASLDFDKEISVITLVAEEGLGDDIAVPLADLPEFFIDGVGGIVTITVPTEEIVGMGPEDAGLFDGLNLNVHTSVDAKLVDAAGDWNVELSAVVTELPAFPASILNMIFVRMVDSFIPAVEDAMHDDNNLLHCEEVEVGDGHWDWLPVNLIAAWEAYGPADGICEFMEDVVLEGSLASQREYLEGVSVALKSVEGMFYDEQFIHQAVGPIHHGIVNPETVGAAKDAIVNFEDKYGHLEINAATDAGRDNIISNEKNNVRMAMEHAFNIAGNPGAGPGRFDIVAPWLESVDDKVDHFSVEVEEFYPDGETSVPVGVSLEWDVDKEAYYLQLIGDGFGTGGVNLDLIAGTESDELAFYFQVDKRIHINGEYDAEGKITMGPLPVSFEPEAGAKGVKTDTEIMVKFDKNIAITDDPFVRIEYWNAGDEHWYNLEPVVLVVDGAILKIQHDGLDYNTEYMVEVHGGTVKCADTGINSNIHISWHFTTGAPMDVEPDTVYVHSYEYWHDEPENIEFNEEFTLTLNYGDFNEILDLTDFELSGIFAEWHVDDVGLAVIGAARDAVNHNQALITVDGYINIRDNEWHDFEGDHDGHYAEGVITALNTGHTIIDVDVPATVKLRERQPDAWLDPHDIHVDVYDGENVVHIDISFTMQLWMHEFATELNAGHFQLGGVFENGDGYFADLAVTEVARDPFHPNEAVFTLSGTLNIDWDKWDEWWHQAEGFITVLPEGHNGDAPLTAGLWVSPPPEPLWADPGHLDLPVFDGENQVPIVETFELGLGYEQFLVLSPEDVQLGGVFAGSAGSSLGITGVAPDHDHDNHYFITVEGNLNISAEDWFSHWNQAEEDHMTGTITVMAAGHTGSEDLTAEIHINPENLHPLTPHFTVSPLHGGSVDGHGWPQDTGITITIENDGGVEVLTEGEITTGGDGHFNYVVGYDNPIHPGDIITVSGGGFTREHTVRYIEVTDFDLENDLIIGKADAGSIVELRVFDNDVDFHDMPFRAPEADAEGNWSADFSISLGDKPSEQPYDLYPGLYGSVEEYDENGNATIYYWGIPNPEFTVQPDKDSISGFDWPDGEDAVEIKVERGGDIIYSETVTATNSWFDVFLGIDIQAGDLVTVTSGVYSASHTVTSLTMTVNRETGEVSGMADPDKVIYLQLQQPADFDGPPQIIEAVEINSVDGSWAHDFGMPIEANQTVSAEQRGDDGGKTAVYNTLD